jgi:hypothetical protein
VLWSFERRLVPEACQCQVDCACVRRQALSRPGQRVSREPSAADGLAAPELASAPHMAPQQAAAVSLVTLPRPRPL